MKTNHGATGKSIISYQTALILLILKPEYFRITKLKPWLLMLRSHVNSNHGIGYQMSCLNMKPSFPGMRIPMLKIRWSRDCLIFNMGIPILVRGHFIFRQPQVPDFCKEDQCCMQDLSVTKWYIWKYVLWFLSKTQHQKQNKLYHQAIIQSFLCNIVCSCE